MVVILKERQRLKDLLLLKKILRCAQDDKQKTYRKKQFICQPADFLLDGESVVARFWQKSIRTGVRHVPALDDLCSPGSDAFR
ncbi:MAG: hypothetical protein M3O22_06960, partial [Pseudomonadota bacterium]|nr:hypothetical protein [Pseudomonadota bacterium]